MGSSQKEKAANHERIVAIAAARIRQDGIDGVSVAEIMREAGLTHGGFYRHFESRDELIAEAVARALWDGSVEGRMAPASLGSRALRVIIYAYLSQGHRDSPATGCAIAALAEDMSRANPAIRDLYGAQVEEDIELLAGGGPRVTPGRSHLERARWSPQYRSGSRRSCPFTKSSPGDSRRLAGCNWRLTIRMIDDILFWVSQEGTGPICLNPLKR
jgi:TetR/AcrR family transcriptional regulator, transcriptional repressor for nem operon